MISLGNIALSLKDRVIALKSDYIVISHFPPPSFGSKSFLRLVLLLTWLFSSSSDVGMKNLANSLTWDGPMHLRGSSWMSCNLSVSESLLLWKALAFSACTCFLDLLSLGRLWGYGGTGTFAAGGAETGLGWFCGWLATCFSTAIRYCWSLKLSIWLLVMGWPCWSLVPVSKVLKERSISSNFWRCRPWCAGWTACLWAQSIRRQLWAALRWCIRWRTISATGTGALCAWASRQGTGQRHRRLTSGGLSYRLQTGRLRVTGWLLWLSEVWMPCSYPCLLDWNEQIWVSHV